MSTRRPAPNFIPSLPPRERAPLRPARPRLPAGSSARQRLLAAVRTRERNVWIVAALSLLLHLLVIAWLIWGPQGGDASLADDEAGVAVVFEAPATQPALKAPPEEASAGHAAAPPLQRQPAPSEAVSPEPPPPPVPYSPPVEPPGPPAPQAQSEQPQTLPQTPPDTPAQTQLEAPDLTEATPAPEMPPVPLPPLPQAAPNLATTEGPSPPMPEGPSEEVLPLPPPAPSASNAAPAPPLTRARPVSPSPLAHPRNWTFAPQARQGASGAPRLPRGALDLSYGETGHGPAVETNENFDLVAPGASQGFMAALHRYAQEHHSYPARAAPLCESGDVTAAITINRDGTVDSVSVERYSQYADLNSAWVHFWGLAGNVPSFTPDMTMAQIVVHFTARYKALGCGAR